MNIFYLQRIILMIICILSLSLLVSCSNNYTSTGYNSQQRNVPSSSDASDVSIQVSNTDGIPPQNIAPNAISNVVGGISSESNPLVPTVDPKIVTTAEGVCIDSDGGVNYALLGSIKDVHGRLDNDRCSRNEFYPNRLIEFNCGSDGVYAKEEYECPFGCEEGVCLTELKIKPIEKQVVPEVVPLTPKKTIEELIAEYTAQFTDGDFYTTFLAVKSAKQDAQIGDDAVVVLRIKNKFGTQKPHYFKVHILGTAKDWVQGGRENGGYLTLGPFETQATYLDVPLKLHIKKTHGMDDEFTTKVGLEYEFRIEVAESRDSYLGYSIEDKSASFMIEVVE